MLESVLSRLVVENVLHGNGNLVFVNMEHDVGYLRTLYSILYLVNLLRYDNEDRKQLISVRNVDVYITPAYQKWSQITWVVLWEILGFR